MTHDNHVSGQKIKETIVDEVVLRYWEEIKDFKELDKQEELTLLSQRNQQEAKDELVKAGLKRVVDIALDYQDQGLELADLIMEGNIGLLKAIERYDIHYKSALKTYERASIRKAIKEAIEDSHHHYLIPVSCEEGINRYHKALKDIQKELKREPTLEELASKMNISVDKVKRIRDIDFGEITDISF